MHVNLSPVMNKLISILISLLIILSLCPGKTLAQEEADLYISEGYFNNLNLNDSVIIKTNLIISISKNKVQIVKPAADDLSEVEVFFQSRCMSPIKYPAANGEFYTVWKLGDRKMILRKINGTRYLSLYQTDEFGLPRQYLTFKIKD